MVLPCQGDSTVAAAHVSNGVFQVFDQGRWFAHLHFHFAKVLRRIVRETPLASFLADDQHPVIGVGNVEMCIRDSS